MTRANIGTSEAGTHTKKPAWLDDPPSRVNLDRLGTIVPRKSVDFIFLDVDPLESNAQSGFQRSHEFPLDCCERRQ